MRLIQRMPICRLEIRVSSMNFFNLVGIFLITNIILLFGFAMVDWSMGVTRSGKDKQAMGWVVLVFSLGVTLLFV